MTQLSLFGGRPLFDSELLTRFAEGKKLSPIPTLLAGAKWLSELQQSTRAGLGRPRPTETTLEQAFNSKFFCDFLGYNLYPGASGRWSAWPKPSSTVSKLPGEPDLLLGDFDRDGHFEPIATVELKKPGTNLDAPQPGKRNLTPVEQGFDYARDLPTCRWVIVTDMRLLRLYAVDGHDAHFEILLDSCIDPFGKPTDALRILHHLLSWESLVKDTPDTSISRLLDACRDQHVQVRDGFYKVYCEIRSDLIAAIRNDVKSKGIQCNSDQIILAAQRLLDRMLFMFFCEDHPDKLLTKNTVSGLADRSLKMPGGSRSKVYSALKDLFRDLDEGRETEGWKIPKYNGELFKDHFIVDHIDLPDSLHLKEYRWEGAAGTLRRRVAGVWGLHIFDFWRELDRDLLGNVFERSVGDISALAADGTTKSAREAFGVVFTAGLLARYVSASVVDAVLQESKELNVALERAVNAATEIEHEKCLSEVLRHLKSVSIADLGCGSGVFLTAGLDRLLQWYRKALEARRADGGGLTSLLLASRQAEILKDAIFGADVLPQAVELAKLALWLTAARLNEPSADLSRNFSIGDSLRAETIDALRTAAGGAFDVILGNPPWGGTYDSTHKEALLSAVGPALTGPTWDSWELFVLLCLQHLEAGGRLALLVPDTLFSPEKKKIRHYLAHTVTIEKVYALGPDWFGPEVRMATVLLQIRKIRPSDRHGVRTMVLAGQTRRMAQQGKRPLFQIENQIAQSVSQQRIIESPDADFQVFCSDADWELLSRIDAASAELQLLTDRARGDEISAEGLVWQCPSCGAYAVPGEKKKGGKYKDKDCPNCQFRLRAEAISEVYLVSNTKGSGRVVPYIDGTVLTRRYEKPTHKYFRTDLQPMFPALKPTEIFRGPKILIRQAGVGLTATLSSDNSRCPQSIYIYRATDDSHRDGYTSEFILGALLSRTMGYYLFKRFGEIDVARAHVKVTHERLSKLPIPKLGTQARRKKAAEITGAVRKMLDRPEYGGAIDHEIEQALRGLWGLTPTEGAYINGVFSLVPDGQYVRDLFPNGAPPFTARIVSDHAEAFRLRPISEMLG